MTDTITDELRKWVRDGKGSLLAIADRIDAEHEKAMSRAGQLLDSAEKERDYNYANWQECKQKVLQHNITIDELDAKIESLEDELSHCIELPKDADDETIHIGDEMEGVDKYDSLKKVMGKVITVSFESDGIVGVAIQAWSSDGKSWHRAYLDPDASVYRHYHAPTVEDVLREMVAAYMDTPLDDSNDDEFFAEYAAKLRLAGES